MAENQTKGSLIGRLLFPRTQGLRVLYHVLFWVLFVLLHYAYALPILARKASDASVTITGFLYFLKIIPEYYLCILLYNLLNRYIRGIFLFVILIFAAILVNHVFSIALFLAVDYAFGLENMPERFRVFANLYLAPFDFRDLNSWLVFSNDLSEAQFMILPAALKMSKFAAGERVMRQKLENDALSMELKALKSQINPHFVFNVLNAAYARILPISEDASEYLLKVSEILRFSLYEMNDEFIRLEKELAYMSLYVELESIRSNKRCRINMVQEGEVMDSHRVPTLSLITLVENAFKHGVHATRHECFVDIHISIRAGMLEFAIANSKPTQVLRSPRAVGRSNAAIGGAHKPDTGWRDTEPKDPGTAERQSAAPRSQALGGPAPGNSGGIGLANLERRLGIYYPGRYRFERTEHEEVFRVLMQFPLH